MTSIPEESFIWFLNAVLFYFVGVGFIVSVPVRETIEIVLEWSFLGVFIGSYSVAMVIYFERD